MDGQTERFLLCESESLRLPLVGDRLSFSGQWLARHYRRERQRWTVRDEEAIELRFLAQCVFPHSDELAVLFDFKLDLNGIEAMESDSNPLTRGLDE